jgi:hypothetical protein
MKKRKGTFNIDDEEYLEEYYIRPDEIEDYEDKEDESVLNSQKDPFNGMSDVVFEDGHLRSDDVEDYSITSNLVIDDSKFNKKGVD